VSPPVELAAEIASRLTTWHMLDMGLVFEQGFMRVAAIPPRGKTGELVAWGVLQGKFGAEGPVLVPTPRFLHVYRIARQRPTPSSPMPSARHHVEP
jgi:hypothetical protein